MWANKYMLQVWAGAEWYKTSFRDQQKHKPFKIMAPL